MDDEVEEESKDDAAAAITAATIDLRDCLVAKLREILRFLARKAFECVRWFLGFFNATSVLVTCIHLRNHNNLTL